jgi:uncharacterized protein (UPF0261 family)
MNRKGSIAILATLDTKAEEVAYMKNLLEARGHSAVIIGCGVPRPSRRFARYLE